MFLSLVWVSNSSLDSWLLKPFDTKMRLRQWPLARLLMLPVFFFWWPGCQQRRIQRRHNWRVARVQFHGGRSIHHIRQRSLFFHRFGRVSLRWHERVQDRRHRCGGLCRHLCSRRRGELRVGGWRGGGVGFPGWSNGFSRAHPYKRKRSYPTK